MSWMERVRRAAGPALAMGLSLSAAVAAAQGTGKPFAGPVKPHPAPERNPKTAVAVLHGAPDHPKVKGIVRFIQEGDHVWVVANVTGVEKSGLYGFHLHEKGQCAPDPAGKHFQSAGGHFNPTGAPHACLSAAKHHAGDLGNLVIERDGTGRVEEATETLALSGPLSVIGRAIVLHAGPDDCASQPAGNSGPRLACGVVEMAAPSNPKPVQSPHGRTARLH
jgi:Cu-Zn family superoxide dismutase